MNWQHQLSCMIHSRFFQLKYSIVLPVIFSYIVQCYTSQWETIKSHWDIRYVYIERTLTLGANYQGAGHQTDIEPNDGHSANTGGWVLAIDIRFPPPVVAMAEALLIHQEWGHQSGARQWHWGSRRNWKWCSSHSRFQGLATEELRWNSEIYLNIHW